MNFEFALNSGGKIADRLEYVYGLKYGSNFFKSGDEVIFKASGDSTEYAAKLYDIGERSFIAYGEDGIEYNFIHEDIEWMKTK